MGELLRDAQSHLEAIAAAVDDGLLQADSDGRKNETNEESGGALPVEVGGGGDAAEGGVEEGGEGRDGGAVATAVRAREIDSMRGTVALLEKRVLDLSQVCGREGGRVSGCGWVATQTNTHTHTHQPTHPHPHPHPPTHSQKRSWSSSCMH